MVESPLPSKSQAVVVLYQLKNPPPSPRCSAGCTFDEDSDPGLCEYRQGQDDDFDWQLIRTYNWPHPTPDLLRGTAPPGRARHAMELHGIGGD
ncbi:Receptor-type tyrosine-protein phosphatase U [Collichthys lucidus]|uniref:Receptor-type tyrosine-protein phosphatase U n=1 Tax=Collichthys lucidus TaxID=240159 RepID=A0A4U5VKT0_COLLU|nr:Receptor-type tyrosine-protein phosphatase U [Collichthys lucidus]